MEVEQDTFIQLNQCLFGYDDGHRLLTASLKLPEEAASLLLLHSDLVAGFNTGRPDGYWTGIPVPAAKAYALMHTWPAPEMPRPGCVWTHAVLIAFADIARFQDLAILRSLFVRPERSASYAAYARPLAVDPSFSGSPFRPYISRQCGLRVLRAVYSSGSRRILEDDGDRLDDAIFAVWSQQWPRLRRAFSFRTAGLASDPSGKSRFDLRVVRELPSTAPTKQIESSQDLWEEIAIEDLMKSEPSQFRRFLWRYGSDIRRGRERYRFLAQLFLETRFSPLQDPMLTRTLDRVVDALPEMDDGKLLKEDFLSCGRSTYSLLPAADLIDTFGYLIGHSDLTALPPIPETAFEAVHDLWSTRAPEILMIAEVALNKSSAIGESLLDRISAVAEPSSFLALSLGHPVIRTRLIRANPALLDSPELTALPQQEILELLASLSESDDLAIRVLDRVLFSDNPLVAVFFADRFFEITQDHVFAALISEVTGSGPPVPRIWLNVVRQRNLALASNLLKRSPTTTALGALVECFGLDVQLGLQASPADWAKSLLRIQDDIRGKARQKLLAYLLTLALASPRPGCEPLFEKSFESTHADISSSRLPYGAFAILAPYLPELPWWQQWDTCLRLRLAVVGAYSGAQLDPKSFLKLTADSTLFNSLIDAAKDTKGGKRFLQRILHKGS